LLVALTCILATLDDHTLTMHLHTHNHPRSHPPHDADAAAAPVGSPLSPATTIDCRHRFTNLSLGQAVRTVQFWLLFGLFLAGVGSCLTFLNNLGQITLALGGAAGDQVVFVSIFAVGNAAGGGPIRIEGNQKANLAFARDTCRAAAVTAELLQPAGAMANVLQPMCFAEQQLWLARPVLHAIRHADLPAALLNLLPTCCTLPCVCLHLLAPPPGRLLMGMLPEHYLHACGTPRTHWLLGTFAVLSASMLVAAAAAHPGHLYLLSLALGLSYGAVFSLIPAIAADVFGLRHFAATYSGLQTACAIGCYVFPTKLAGEWLAARKLPGTS
jgi:hypothetical protein